MPGQLFNLSRYFGKGKGQQDQPKDEPETVATTQSPPISEPSQKSFSYSGIGKPLQGETYSGIGTPPRSKTQPGAIDMQKRVGMDIMTRLTERSSQILLNAVNKVKELKEQYVDSHHLLWALVQDPEIYQMLSELKAIPLQIQQEIEKNFKPGNFSANPQLSPRVKKILELALSAARSLGFDFISPEHMLLAICQEGEGLGAKTLTKFGITVEILNKKILGAKADEDKKKKASAIEQFCQDLTAEAREGKLDPVVQRGNEIERVIHILSRRRKNNPCLIGEAGVGKTAIVEGLAQKIVQNDVPETLLNKRILQLDLMSLIAGATHRGDFEERLKNLIKEIKSLAGQVILFIDEIHNMVGAGAGGEGAMDASNILKPSLARGELQTVGATTITEYRKYIEKDPALERRFQPVLVPEPTAEQTIEMLRAIRDKYEAFHKVTIPDDSIESAVLLSQRYIADRFLPDKAVDLIDEAASAIRIPAISLPEEIKSAQDRLKRLENEKLEAQKSNDQVRLVMVQKEIDQLQKKLQELQEKYELKKSISTDKVTPELIAEIVSRWTNIPVSKLTQTESQKLLKLEDILHQRIINQEGAVAAIAEAVRRGRAGLKSTKRPIGSFIFMGPTGVGKTELAKALAEALFGSEEMIVRLDMTEYMEKHEVAKLIGAPPGYVGYEEGGQLTEAVRRKPYSVVLFDEIEKAHPDVFNILIQLLDDGRLTDNKGRTISFKNTIVICTSNIGTGLIQEEILGIKPAKRKESSSARAKDDKIKSETPLAPPEEMGDISDEQFALLAEKLLDELRKFFRPELLNRFDEIIVFRPLKREHTNQIVELQIKGLSKLLEEQGIGIKLTENARNEISRQGFDPIFGARPLRRTIQRLIENPVSLMLIEGKVSAGQIVQVDFDGQKLVFQVEKPQPTTPATPPAPRKSAMPATEQPQKQGEDEELAALFGDLAKEKPELKEEPKAGEQKSQNTQSTAIT